MFYRISSKYVEQIAIVRLILCFKSKESSSNSRSAPKPRVNDGLKMRASVRMTRYLESWGAVKPFAHLQNRDGFTADTIGNGKTRCRVRMFTVKLLGKLGLIHKLKIT